MRRVVVIDAECRKSAVDWWRWGVIALATTVLCSCSSLQEPKPNKFRGGPPSIQAASDRRQLAPIVVPERDQNQQAQPWGGESILVEDEQMEPFCHVPEAAAVPCPPVACPHRIFPRDEYLCDGGDGVYRGSLDDVDGEGIEPSDTIAQFDSELRRGHVVASNRACIYAPRFAATRRIYRVREGESYDRVGGLHEAVLTRSEIAPTVPNDVIQDLAVERQIVETIDHELQDATRGLLLDETDVLAESGVRELPFESGLAAHSVQLDRIQRVREEQQGVNAIQWTNIESVELAIDGRPAQAVSDVGPPSDVYIYEVNREPRLRLTKTLSTPAAEPGDVVVITIHYDNIGDSPIENLRIVDSLTTRLEFIPDSNVSSRRALFSTRDNSVGSSRLLWEVRDTVQPGEDGEVQFRCRVR